MQWAMVWGSSRRNIRCVWHLLTMVQTHTVLRTIERHEQLMVIARALREMFQHDAKQPISNSLRELLERLEQPRSCSDPGPSGETTT
jgi:hypothetical protein